MLGVDLVTLVPPSFPEDIVGGQGYRHHGTKVSLSYEQISFNVDEVWRLINEQIGLENHDKLAALGRLGLVPGQASGSMRCCCTPPNATGDQPPSFSWGVDSRPIGPAAWKMGSYASLEKVFARHRFQETLLIERILSGNGVASAEWAIPHIGSPDRHRRGEHEY